MNVTAFNPRPSPLSLKLSVMFRSDVENWEGRNMRRPLVEGGEFGGEEWLSLIAFKECAFTDPVRVHTSMNPAFFDGSAVEDAVAEYLPRRLSGAPAHQASDC
jgi:hypothetical protein